MTVGAEDPTKIEDIAKRSINQLRHLYQDHIGSMLIQTSSSCRPDCENIIYRRNIDKMDLLYFVPSGLLKECASILALDVPQGGEANLRSDNPLHDNIENSTYIIAKTIYELHHKSLPTILIQSLRNIVFRGSCKMIMYSALTTNFSAAIPYASRKFKKGFRL